MHFVRQTYLQIRLRWLEALCDALVLADSDALVEALCDADVLADSLALVEALYDALVLADSLALVDALCERQTYLLILTHCRSTL